MKKSTIFSTSKIPYESLITTAKDIGKTKIKVTKTAQVLKITAKKKQVVRVRVAKTAKKLKTIAKDIGRNRLEVAKTAEKIKTASRWGEKIRDRLVKEDKKSKSSAKIKEAARFKLIEIAKQLAIIAKEKEVVRIKLAKTAKQLKLTAEEKEKTRIKLTKTTAIVKELSDRNEAILSSIGDAAFACDKKGTITLFNKMAEEIVGVARKDAIGLNFTQVIHFINEKTGEESYDFISEAIKKKRKTKMESDTLIVRKDGKKIPVADTAAPIFDSSGTVTGCVVVFRDVTKERSVDRAKTELVSLASHQLRTPLTAIGWYVELLQSETSGELTGKQISLTKEIRDAHKRMTSLINSLLNVSRIEMGTFAVDPIPTNIKVVVKTTLNLFKHQIDAKDLSLKERYANNLENYKADPKILGIIIQNLISNAVKYTPKGGKIEISIRKSKFFEITVADTGMGIPKDQQVKIFTKLFRADNANNVDPNGTGLGLYIVHEIVKASGGTLRFESEIGKGSTFYIRYPLKGMSKKEGGKSLS